MQAIDLSKLSAEELQAELKKRENAREEERKVYKQMVDEQIGGIVLELKKVSQSLSDVKLSVFDDLKTLLSLKSNVYNTKNGQQSHTFSDKKGNSITYGFRVLDSWDDTVNAGIDKVKDFLKSLAKDEETGRLVEVINRLLKKDAKGNLKASRVLELIKIADDFNNEDFKDAVKIIQTAYAPIRSAYFIEASYTNSQGKKIGIPLSISSCPFPENVDEEALFPVADEYKR